MIGRRALFGRIAGAIAASQVLSPKDVIAAAQSLSLPAAAVGAFDPMPSSCTSSVSNAILQALWRKREERSGPSWQMPPDIATKRSWSPAYKQLLAVYEEREFRAALDIAQRDEATARKLAAFIGVAL